MTNYRISTCVMSKSIEKISGTARKSLSRRIDVLLLLSQTAVSSKQAKSIKNFVQFLCPNKCREILILIANIFSFYFSASHEGEHLFRLLLPSVQRLRTFIFIRFSFIFLSKKLSLREHKFFSRKVAR